MSATGPRVLIVGGYGVFGGRLATLVARHAPQATVVVAGRDLSKARRFAAEIGPHVEAVAVDRDQPLDAAFRGARPDVVVDAAGPFQSYGDDPYRLARAALDVGAHAIDLSDDAAFTAGIVALDGRARAAGRAVISGASSVPAISSAAVATLTADLDQLEVVESAILPGNRAPRGLSVTRAILTQAGRPLTIVRGGAETVATAWGDTVRIDAPGVGRRAASAIGAPDVTLFPDAFGARSVLFRAGLELGVLHHGLRLAAAPVRAGWISSLAPYTRLFHSAARLFEPFGTDVGGMVVRVAGRRAGGGGVERRWSLAARAGLGPSVPAIPALALIQRLDALAPGARPCLRCLTLADIEAALALLPASTARDERAVEPIFEAALGAAGWRSLPAPVRALHDVWDLEVFEGEAAVTRGRSLLARLLAEAMGFPRSGGAVPVRVEIERRGDRETWTRTFAGRRLVSRLRRDGEGVVEERMGPVRARIALRPKADSLVWETIDARVLGVKLPRALAPGGDIVERADPDGVFRFDVDLRVPLIGPIVRYRGRLRSNGAPRAAPLSGRTARG